MWGAISQLAKRETNLSTSDLSTQMGVSSSGPAALKLAARTNTFTATLGIARPPIELTNLSADLSSEAAAIRSDFGKAARLVR